MKLTSSQGKKKKHPGIFLDVTDKDVDKLIEGEENSHTKRLEQLQLSLNLLKNFLVEERSEIRNIEKIPPTELDSYLSQFDLAARTKTEKDYEPSSLRGIWWSFQRHLSCASYTKARFKRRTLHVPNLISVLRTCEV